MFAQVSTFLKKNISVILFFVFISFVAFSVWFNGQQSTTNAKELISFTKLAIEQVDGEFATLIFKTALVQNESQIYDDTTSEIQKTATKINDLASKVPSKNTDTPSVNLSNSLKKFLVTIKVETMENIKNKLNLQKVLLSDYINYGKLKNLSQSGTKEDLQKALQSGQNILAFEKNQASLIREEKAKGIKDRENNDEQQRLDSLKSLLEKISTPELSQANRDELGKIYNNIWPLEIPLFPKITAADLKTKAFSDGLTELQRNANEVARQFNIT